MTLSASKLTSKNENIYDAAVMKKTVHIKHCIIRKCRCHTTHVMYSDKVGIRTSMTQYQMHIE
jgi:hypothetical protein